MGANSFSVGEGKSGDGGGASGGGGVGDGCNIILIAAKSIIRTKLLK